jgi:dihydroorotase
MSILIKSAKILASGSSLNDKKHNIFISDAGIIKHIGKDAPPATKTVEGKNLKVSIGWFDMRANFNDPGLEHKEDLESGLQAAASGGFTGVALLPNTHPCVESKNEVSYLMSKNARNVCQAYPMGAVTKNCKGEEFTEILDMHHAGAVAFTDGENPIWNTDILHKTLLYLQKNRWPAHQPAGRQAFDSIWHHERKHHLHTAGHERHAGHCGGSHGKKRP